MNIREEEILGLAKHITSNSSMFLDEAIKAYYDWISIEKDNYLNKIDDILDYNITLSSARKIKEYSIHLESLEYSLIELNKVNKDYEKLKSQSKTKNVGEMNAKTRYRLNNIRDSLRGNTTLLGTMVRLQQKEYEAIVASII